MKLSDAIISTHKPYVKLVKTKYTKYIKICRFKTNKIAYHIMIFPRVQTNRYSNYKSNKVILVRLS